MRSPVFVGIDTSNYTTSAAVVSDEGEVLANLKRPLPVRSGECGLRQSDAVFAHIKNLPELMAELRPHLEKCEVLAVGVSATPRPIEGSYMPCFLSGIAAAEAFGAAACAPVYRFSHQEGHLMAALYSAGAMQLTKEPFGAFHVSGGTTEMLLVKPREVGFDIALIGGTADINAGQAIDRAGVMMGLSFPCGREMEALARAYNGPIRQDRISVKGGRCNLSGLQNRAEALWKATADRCAVSAYVFDFIGRTLVALTEDLDRMHPNLPVVYAGGVMSNRILQGMLSKRPDTHFSEPVFSADNAAGTALLARRQFLLAEQ